MINETNFLKAALAYLNANVPGVVFYPAKQKIHNMKFPCCVVNLASKPTQLGVSGELLALVTMHITVYAEELYSMQNSSGVMDLCDTINATLGDKGFERSNQTEPFYNPTFRKWARDIQFKAKANAF